jgi:ParB/RepB/Spo0J family partition protein
MPGSAARRRARKPLVDEGLVSVLQPDEENLRAAAESTSAYFEGRMPLGFLASVPVGKLRPRPDQPRVHFDEEELRELAETFRDGRGVLQPLLCRPVAEENVYEIVAGERRWRAAQMVGLKTVPVIAKERTDLEVQIDALLENIARQDLAPIEEAKALGRLAEQYDSAAECARVLGWTRQRLGNKMRLLKLDRQIVDKVEKRPHAYSWFQLIEVLRIQEEDGVEKALLALVSGGSEDVEKENELEGRAPRPPKPRKRFLWEPKANRGGGFQLKVVAKTKEELPQAIAALKDLLTRLEAGMSTDNPLKLDGTANSLES